MKQSSKGSLVVPSQQEDASEVNSLKKKTKENHSESDGNVVAKSQSSKAKHVQKSKDNIKS